MHWRSLEGPPLLTYWGYTYTVCSMVAKLHIAAFQWYNISIGSLIGHSSYHKQLHGTFHAPGITRQANHWPMYQIRKNLNIGHGQRSFIMCLHWKRVCRVCLIMCSHWIHTLVVILDICLMPLAVCAWWLFLILTFGVSCADKPLWLDEYLWLDDSLYFTFKLSLNDRLFRVYILVHLYSISLA